MKKYVSFSSLAGLVVSIFSLTGLYASLILSIEKLVITENSKALLSCNLNSAINCTSVMQSWQANILGFPNTYFGLIGYAITFSFGLFLIFRKDLGKFLGISGLLGSFLAFVFSYWLLWQSAFSIGAICLYCVLSCISATNIFVAFLLMALKENYLEFSEKLHTRIKSHLDKSYYWILIVLWYVVIVGVMVFEFRELIA